MMRRLVVMGVSGCGKTTLKNALALRWQIATIEGDELHSAANVAKMSSGIPLTDDDRWPWLDRIGQSILEAGEAVASCSALRARYRDRLRNTVGENLRFVMIDLSRSDLELRVGRRTNHYMPASLLDSQLLTLERPNGEPDVLIIDGRLTIETLCQRVAGWIANAQ